MKCSECEYSEKIMGGCVPVFCTYGEGKYFLSEWSFDKEKKPLHCPYRTKIVYGRTTNEHEDIEPDIH